MPLSVVQDYDGLCVPVVKCDGCGERIVDAIDGNFLFLTEDDGEPCSPLYFAHNRCTEALAKEKGEDLWCYYSEMSMLPAWLGNNLGLNIALPGEENDSRVLDGFFNRLEEDLEALDRCDEYLWYLAV